MTPEFQGTKTLQPFSPRWTDPELLEKTLVGRRVLVDKLEQLAIEGAGGPNKYQRLIIGPRGSGKTHVLKVLHTRLWRNASLKDRLLIVYLLEDELGVASFLDFLVRLLKAIVAWHPDHAQLAKELEELYDLPSSAMQRRAMDLLWQAAGTRDLLIIMENLGITFDSKMGFGRKGQQALRDLVQQNPRFMIFASAQALLDGISEPNAPFYEFFKIEPLHKLSLEEAMEFLAAVAQAYGNADVEKFLSTVAGKSRVHAIYDFTGGNHRLLVTFYDFLAADSLSRLSDAFIEALKPLKPYYQEQMRSLSAQQQKIVQYLSIERTPKTVKEIARGSLATSNTVSSQMKALLERGFVERIPQGRETYYEISETLFRICYEADLDHQGAPIRLFVDFLGNFYTAQELEVRARGFRLLARTLSSERPAHEIEAAFYQAALLQYHKHPLPSALSSAEDWKSFFQNLAEHRAFVDIISFAKRLGDSKDSSITMVEADAYIQSGKVQEACAILKKEAERKPEDASLQASLGAALLRAGDAARAEPCCRRALALDPSNVTARRTLVQALTEAGRHAEALEQISPLIDSETKTEAYDLVWLGYLQQRLGHRAEAEEAFRRAIVTDANYAEARLRLGWHLGSEGRWEDALQQFETALTLEPDGANGYAGAGVALGALGHNAESESKLRVALARDRENPEALRGTGVLLMLTGRLKEALGYFLTLSTVDQESNTCWYWLGLTYRDLGELDQAEVSLRKSLALNDTGDTVATLAGVLLKKGLPGDAETLLRAGVEKWPENARVIGELARCLGLNGRWGESLEYYREAQKLGPKNPLHWAAGGLTALAGGDLVGAEQQARKATEIDERSALGWLVLGLVMTETGRYRDATEFLERAASMGLSLAFAWLELGKALQENHDFEAAESAIRRAIALNQDADTVEALFSLSSIMLQQGRIGEAAEVFTKAIQAKPEDAAVVDGLQSNLDALFSFCTKPQMGTFLEPVLEVLNQEGRLSVFEQALSLSVFQLLKNHESVAEERFSDTIWALENLVAKQVGVSVAVLFLNVGVEFLKRGDRKALMRLSREERVLFKKELGIDTDL
jgi:tetratricopeptide (TPR) repeat protein